MLTDEFGPAKIQANATLGWEDGLYISRDGLHLFAFYAPIDVLKFGMFVSTQAPGCIDSTPFLRGPLLGMDFTTNPYGCKNVMHSDIVHASRASINDDFGPWALTVFREPAVWEGEPVIIDNGDGTFDFIYDRSTDDNMDDLYWLRNSSDFNPVSAEGQQPFPMPPNSQDEEGNPHVERLGADDMILMYDNDVDGLPDITIKYSISRDNGVSWTVAKELNTVNSASPVDVQGHLWQDGSGNWWIYFASVRGSEGKREIYRARHKTNDLLGDFDDFGDAEKVIGTGSVSDGSGTIEGMGDPTLTSNGDISFTVVVCRKDDPTYSRCDIDPWMVRRKP